jgi:outer membrane protein assembly factor BamB
MHRRFTAVPALVASVLLGLLAAPTDAEDWNQWRGPNRDGHIPGLAVPKTWPKELKREWKVEVGDGHSSPVVAGSRVFVLSRQDENEVVRGLRLADGRELWLQKYPVAYKPSPYAGSHGKWPRATPVVADGRLVTVGVTGVVSCWDAASGKLLWQNDFSKEFKAPPPLFYGMSVSPIVVDGMVIVAAGVNDDGALVAIDLAGGEIKWKWTGDGPGYSSPILATLAGTRQLIVQSQNNCIGVAPADGSLLWSIPYKTEYDQNIITPVVAGELVIFSGLESGTTAYRLKKIDGKLAPEKVWHNRQISMYMSTPVVVGDGLYGLNNRSKGQFVCLDLAKGETRWTSEGRMGDNAAILAADGLLMALCTSGQLIVFKAAPQQFETIARYEVADSPTWAYPAIAGGRILVKDRTALSSWTLRE